MRSTITCSTVRSRSAAGSTSSSDDRLAVDQQPARSPCGAGWRSSRRPRRPPVGGSAAALARVGRGARPRAVGFVDARASSSTSGASTLDTDASTTGRSKPISSRVPGGSAPSCARDDLGRFAHDFLAAVAAEGPADAREQQPHVVVDLGRRADRRARIADAVLLADRDRRRDAVDAIDVGLLHPLEELARVGRQRLDVAALPFGVDRVEGERRLARAADAGHDDQLADRQREVDVLEVVRARAAHDDVLGFSRPGDGRIGHARCYDPAAANLMET